MFRNYLMLTLRTLFRNKVHFLINILGLAVGIATCLLIVVYVQSELSYDRHHHKADCIFRITSQVISAASNDHAAFAPSFMATQLKEKYPELENAVRITDYGGKATIRYKDKLFKEQDIRLAEKTIFDVFTYSFIQGNPATALANPNSVVITQSLAEKYFSKENPMGKLLQVNGREYAVTAILEDLPANSDMHFNALLSVSEEQLAQTNWVFLYLLFKDATSGKNFMPKLDAFANEHINKEYASAGIQIKFQMEALPDVHFSTQKLYDTPKGNISYVYTFSVVAVLVLLIACINYINLSIAQSSKRSVEVGVRKVVGAAKFQLVTQFIGESLLITAFALLLAVTMVQLANPFFYEITGKQVSILSLFTPQFLLFLLVLLLIVGIGAGSYPALYTTSFKPVQVLKGRIPLAKGSGLRKVLITVQFAVSITVISSTLIVYQQMNYLRKTDLGFRKEQVLVLDVPGDDASVGNMPVLQEKLLENPAIRNVSLCEANAVPGNDLDLDVFSVEQNQGMQTKSLYNIYIDENYLDVLQISLVAGRNFSRDRLADHSQSVLVNESFVKAMGWQEAIGKKLSRGKDNTYQVIGVVKDFHYKSLHNKIEPLVMLYGMDGAEQVMVSLSAEDLVPAMNVIRSAWKEVIVNHPIEYAFLDASFEKQYLQEERMMRLFSYFSLFTVLIACMGLFGLASFATAQRTKEIGVRKVMGASVSNILFLLSKDFIKLVLLANVVALPLAYWGIYQWLQNYAFRIELNLWLFVLPGIFIVAVALLTISLQTMKAARANPVKSLRYE